MSILIFNAGSSSLKFSLFDDTAEQTLVTGTIQWLSDSGLAQLSVQTAEMKTTRPVGKCDIDAAAQLAISTIQEISLPEAKAIRVVGHRIVHGGTAFRTTQIIDGPCKVALRQLSDLAPVHNPPALAVIEIAEGRLPTIPHVGVFDTAFFADLPPRAHVYPLPYEWYEEWGIRRFGFHGISHAYCTQRATEFLGQTSTPQSLVICHLGNGCSATAVRHGRPVATTMGFTPLDGLMMGTRPGDLDPGILIHLQNRYQMSSKAIEESLQYRSGLLGVSGISSDYREVEAAAQRGNERAQLALDIYADKLRSTIGALAVTLGHVEALIFTGGVGENSARLRATVCHGLECLGIHLDEQRNESAQPDVDVAQHDYHTRVLVLHTREDTMVAQQARLFGKSDHSA